MHYTPSYLAKRRQLLLLSPMRLSTPCANFSELQRVPSPSPSRTLAYCDDERVHRLASLAGGHGRVTDLAKSGLEPHFILPCSIPLRAVSRVGTCMLTSSAFDF